MCDWSTNYVYESFTLRTDPSTPVPRVIPVSHDLPMSLNVNRSSKVFPYQPSYG